jgi:FtsP/CotA-like multicopper oxidase with cupredoxin domain
LGRASHEPHRQRIARGCAEIRKGAERSTQHRSCGEAVEDGDDFNIRSGAPQRWRFVNASKSRYFVLDLDGQPFTLIGTDGGLQEYQSQKDSIALTPGERVDVVVMPTGNAEGTVLLRTFLMNRGYGSIEFRPAETELMTMNVADMPPYSGPMPKKVARALRPLDVASGPPVDMKLAILQLAGGEFEYRINGRRYEQVKPFQAKPGETQIWTVTNETPWSHPYHLHGFFFQVLDDNGAPVRPLAWKDTVDVPFKETRKIAVRFDEEHEGNWMIHCHILDHAEGGLMGTVQVGAHPSEMFVLPVERSYQRSALRSMLRRF